MNMAWVVVDFKKASLDGSMFLFIRNQKDFFYVIVKK